jgi:hypothetical protein
MRTHGKSAVMSVAFLMGAAIAVNAQQEHRPSPAPTTQLSLLPPPNTALPAVAPANGARHPESWYYNPYTGPAACPQGGNGGPKCEVLMPRSRQ